MRALTVDPTRSGSLRLDELADPEPGPGELLVDGLAVGVCGTDREIADGAYGWPPPGQDRLILGHESLGRVRSAPEDSDFAAGGRGVAVVGPRARGFLFCHPIPPRPPPPALPPLAIPPVPAPPAIAPPAIAPVLPGVPALPVVAPPAPAAPAPPAAAPAPGASPALAAPSDPDVRNTSAEDGLPEPKVLTVIGGLIALTLAGAGSGAVSFQSASAAQARIDAARAEFFGTGR
ncbi:alcohol dehydrogenase catalytic domain-containing protein [Nocardia cyriacigeorgica]|uniref:alcohol dehydrogenase catalytic domain-containing protein n=1 Tax=Nocardia cyriacigeorgica TaxID=135487 RepID=UPI002454D679|nr:alcohol dehydrogenase catalytic domain-containing protein [Nocardia cyriacigeorgica]